MFFVWIWEQTAIISLYYINWLVFITGTLCAYGAVRTGSLYITEVTLQVTGQSVWDLWWTKWHWDRGFSQYLCFPLSISFHRCSTFIYLLLWAGQWAKPGKLPCSYGSWGALGRKYCYLLWRKRLVPGCPCKIRGQFTWNLWWGRRHWAMYFRVVILPAALSMFVQRQTLPLAVSCLQAD